MLLVVYFFGNVLSFLDIGTCFTAIAHTVFISNLVLGNMYSDLLIRNTTHFQLYDIKYRKLHRRLLEQKLSI